MSGPTAVEGELRGRILSGERQLPQRQLLDNVARAASGLAAIGVGSEDAVAIVLRNDFPFFEASMAANALGAHAVPINWHFKAEEAGYVLDDCSARAVVVHGDLLPELEPALPAGIETFVVATPEEVCAAYGISEQAARIPSGARSWSSWLAEQEPRELGTPPPPSSMIYTSGTTGHPKGVRRKPFTEESGAKFSAMVAEVFDLRPDGEFRTVITGPMYHAAPNAYALYAARNGGLCLLQPRFDPEELLALIEAHRITHLHMVPTMFVRLLKLPDEVRGHYDLSSLKWVIHAAAPCPPAVKRQMIDWWGPVIHEYYGASETGAVVFHTAEEALRKPGTVGRPLTDALVRIYDEEGRVLPAGEVGEIFARVVGMPDFTYHGQEERRREIERDGLVSVGDVGYLDEDGYLFLCDRKNDMVISGGVNIYPAEIEAVLIGMPEVHDCAVFGIPHEEFGESLCAFVEPEPGARLSSEQIRDFLARHLAGYKVPRRIELRDSLPREDSGKIFKRKLRDPFWKQAGRQI